MKRKYTGKDIIKLIEAAKEETINDLKKTYNGESLQETVMMLKDITVIALYTANLKDKLEEEDQNENNS